MWPLVIGAGALWYLTRLRRNPDWITTNGVHRPLRAGDGRSGDATPYYPERVGETKTTRTTTKVSGRQTEDSGALSPSLRRAAIRYSAAKAKADRVQEAYDNRARPFTVEEAQIKAAAKEVLHTQRKARSSAEKESAAVAVREIQERWKDWRARLERLGNRPLYPRAQLDRQESQLYEAAGLYDDKVPVEVRSERAKQLRALIGASPVD